MKVLFNCSINIVGGGLKNSAFFIKQAVLHKSEIEWYFAVSHPVFELISKWGIELESERVLVFKDSPAGSKQSRKQLMAWTKKSGVKLVYTMAGPAYVRFPVYHIMGLSNPYVTHGDWSSFRLKGNFKKITKALIETFIRFVYSKLADFFLFQTEQARKSYIRRAFIKKEVTAVVPNAFDEEMKNQLTSAVNIDNDGIFKVFCPGAGHLHKGFQFVPAIAHALLSMPLDKEVEFQFTLPEEGTMWRSVRTHAEKLGVLDKIKNIGPYHYTQAAQLYAQSDMVFVPSLLETFSASYLEAMAAKKPLLVAEKDFARDVCDSYAYYTDPRKPLPSAKIIMEIIQSASKSEVIIVRNKHGERILKKFGNHEERFVKIMHLIQERYPKNI